MFPEILDQIQEIMTKPVITAKADDLLVTTAKIMLDRRIGCVVVAEGEKIVGIVTEGDLIKCAALGHDPNRTPVKDVMSKPPVMCAPQTRIEEAYALMRRNQIRHLPIVEDGNIVGIVTMKDLVSVGKLIL